MPAVWQPNIYPFVQSGACIRAATRLTCDLHVCGGAGLRRQAPGDPSCGLLGRLLVRVAGTARAQRAGGRGAQLLQRMRDLVCKQIEA